MQKYKIPFSKLLKHSHPRNNNLSSFKSSFKSLRNFSTVNNTLFNNNSSTNNNSSVENFFNQILSEIKELDKISDNQIFATTLDSLRKNIYSQIDKLQTVYQGSYSLELKKNQVILQSILRKLLVSRSENPEAILNNFLNLIEDANSERVKNLIKVRHETIKHFQQLNPTKSNKLKDLPQGKDWFKEYVKEEMNGGGIVYQEFFSSHVNLNDLLNSTNTTIQMLQHYFMKEGKEFGLIIGFYLTTYYLSGINLFGNIVRQGDFLKDNDNLLTVVLDNIKLLLDSCKLLGSELDLNYKIKDIELLDEDITLQSCVDCLQFLQLLLQSNGDTHSIQQVLDNYKEKHQSNYLFSFIYSVILYQMNRKQEAHDILKQLTLLVKENKTLQPTTLPIAYWFLRVCVDLNVNKVKKDIDSVKLACEEAVKGDLSTMKIIPSTKSLRYLSDGYLLCEDYENHFDTCFTMLDEIPYLFFEEQLIATLQMFCLSGFKQIEKGHSPIYLMTILSRYAAYLLYLNEYLIEYILND
ncbi:hypothetical protein ABK040_005640 [Willaertia magna]